MFCKYFLNIYYFLFYFIKCFKAFSKLIIYFVFITLQYFTILYIIL